MLTFGDNILLWRLHRSLSQAQLATISGIPRPNLSNIETGKRDVTLSTIRYLATALGVLPGTLVNGEPPNYKKRNKKLSRDYMERVARSVALGIPPKDSEKRQLHNLLREVLSNSLKYTRTHQTRLPMPTRKSSRAWLQLRALYPKEILNSLIVRTREHAERL